MAKKQIIVLGAGFAGLHFVRSFRHPDAAITIIDQQNHHLFQPLLYQVATAGLAMPEIAEPIRSIFAKRLDVKVLMAKIEQVDLEARAVHLDHGTLSYDYLVIGLGMVNAYFGRDEWAQHTVGLKTIAEARRIRRKVLYAFERAEATRDLEERRRLMTVVVIGGGATGIEMAGALVELTRRVFKEDFRAIRPQESRVILIEAADRLLGNFAEESSADALHALEKMGVDVRLKTMVQEIAADKVTLEDETIETGTIIWTAGVEASPIVRALPVEQDRRGRVLVAPDTSLPGYPEVFAIGDNAALTDVKGQVVPGVSPAAIQMGQHVSKIVKRELKAGPRQAPARPPFKYWNKGSMATIGRSSAVAELGRFRFAGFTAWVLWLFVHLVFLVGFRSKLAVLLQWFFAYVRFRPGARVFERPGSYPDPPSCETFSNE